ncbi:3369_t:CDS:2 [Dentiscutata heterogama]|uniref:3369_t:CDS:1 n=1 Tax=Dentiscutata heterogama TaxID=1316150 RepID=A0ACA9KQ13_9GLOM|nr:3369_t:CDS:2 [Dentiscutata heterogama]
MDNNPHDISSNVDRTSTVTPLYSQNSSLIESSTTSIGSLPTPLNNNSDSSQQTFSMPTQRQSTRSAVLSSVLSSTPNSSSLATTSVRATAPGSRQVRRNWWGYILENFRSISRTSKHYATGRATDLLTDHRRNGQNQNDNNEPIRRDSWVDRFKSFLDLFATLWFIIGNYLLFTTQNCATKAPEIFFLSLTWVILGYIVITIPILLCLAVIFCLPCVLVAMRILHVGDAVGISGASDDVIQKIPLAKFKALQGDSNVSESQTTDTIVSVSQTESSHQPISSTPKKSRFNIFGRKKKGTHHLPVAQQTLTIPNPDDAVCSICLSAYEDGDELRNLWCSHHFHKDCVDEWLSLNRRCPMCRSSSTGGRVDVSSSQGESAEDAAHNV